MNLVLVENGEIWDPSPRGKRDLLLDGSVTLLMRAEIDKKALDATKLEYERIDADGCYVLPGLIDPHVHLLGASGETGFSSQSPEIFLSELLRAGITTVVGTLGVNTSTHTMHSLLAAAKALKEEGLSAYVYTGGYDVPPMCITGSVRNDMLYIDEVIGVGEIAISDERSMHPEPRELARIVTDAYVGRILTQKAGVAHFHVGEGKDRLKILRTLLEDFEIKPEQLYPTHVERSKKLFLEAIALAKRGANMDIDTVEEDLAKWLRFFREHNGPADRLTVSSDSHYCSPFTRLNQFRECLLKHKLPLEFLLPLFTKNPARVLSLKGKGVIGEGTDSAIAVFTKKDFELRHVVSHGRVLYRNGRALAKPSFLKITNRHVHLDGEKESGQAA
jgi:beta-aspartyl-dipeptidase (metallo-type)